MIVKNNSLIINSLGFPQIDDIHDLSKQIRLSTRLLYCLSMQTKSYYKSHEILKKDKSPRKVYAPSYTLYIVQKWILKNILNKVQPSQRAMAFRVGNKYGCKANAKFHIGTLYGLSIDLKDFFPSIKADKIFTVFQNLGYNNLSATILTNLCSLNNELPQGGVCSPALSNLVCRSLDNRLIGLCEKRAVRYTRYADDMYFSCDNKDLLHKIHPIIIKIINDEGYVINDKKTHFHTPSNRKQITGITVVDTENTTGNILKAKKDFKKNIRTNIHKSIITGDYSDMARILGLITYVNFIESAIDNSYLQKVKDYIKKTSDKIIHNKELVDAYNSNKFYKDIPDLIYQPYNWSKMDEYDLDELSSLLESRKEYLHKKDMDDICKYDGWPDFVFNYNIKEYRSDDESPFDTGLFL